MTVHFDPQHERQEWLEDRLNGIGGSDAAIIMMMNKYEGPLTLYYKRKGFSAEDDDAAPQEAAYWGTRLEPVLIEEFERRTGLAVPLRQQVLVNPKLSWQRGTIDGLVYENPSFEHRRPLGVLELKTTGVRREHDWDAGIPEAPWCQLQHYLSVTGLERGWVCVLIGGQDFRVFEVERDEEFISSRLIPAEAEFWRRLQEDDPPEPDELSSTNKLMDERFPDSIEDLSVQLPDGAVVHVGRIASLKREIKDLEGQVNQSVSWLKDKLGKAEYGKVDEQIVCTWKSQTVSRIEVAKLKAEQPGVADQYTKTTTERRFLVKAPWIDDDE